MRQRSEQFFSPSGLPYPRAAGFTLVELMVTIAILVIVVTVAVPSFNSLVQSNRLTGTTNQLLSTYHLARSEAIKRSANVRLCATANGTTCNQSSDWSRWLVTAGAEVIAVGIVRQDVVVAGPQNTSVIFTPAGLVRDENGAGFTSSLRVCTTSSAVPNNTRTLSFVAGGSVEVSRGVSSCD